MARLPAAGAPWLLQYSSLVTTTRSIRPAGLDSPPAGAYPTGFAGYTRAWDGAAWTPEVLPRVDAPAHETPPSMLRRPPFYVAGGGVVLGAALAALSGTSTPLLILAGVLATGGPLAALMLGLHRRLGLSALPLRAASVWGVAAGILALVIAYGAETLLRTAGVPDELLLAAAGPIEEGGKILLPLVLLAVGAAHVRDPRLGVWCVAISGAVFGVTEGIEYVGQLSPDAREAVQHLQATAPGANAQTAQLVVSVSMAVQRGWVELGHVFWTAGAAALIWLAVHQRSRRLVLVVAGALVGAAAIHSFNDAGLSLLPSFLQIAGSIVVIALSYTLWFRRPARRLVPPDALDEVPYAWLPRLPHAARTPRQNTA